MINRLETALINYLDQEHYSGLERKKLTFGIQIVLSETFKLLLIYLVAFLLNCIIPTLIIHLTFFLLRQVCLGYHFNNLYVCLVWSTLAFPLAAGYIADIDVVIPTLYLYTGSGILLVLIYMLAPKGTENQPVINQMHRNYLRKKMTIRLLLIVVVLILSPLKIKYFIIYGILLETTMLLIQTLKERVINE